MRIGIIGAGFYGITIAIALDAEGHEVEIFEKSTAPMMGASRYNQHRLHLGFHYPRCDITIAQAKITFDRFLADYSSACFPIENNFYLNHIKSNVDRSEFLTKMDNHNLSYEISSLPAEVKTTTDFDLSLKVPEMYIEMISFREQVLERLSKTNVKLFLNSPKTICDLQSSYDYVINCSYVDPGSHFNIQTKSELAILLLCKSDESWANKAITIMDGPFCSIYPAGEGLHTISSVAFTPAIKANHAAVLEKAGQSLDAFEWNQIEQDIWKHAESFIDLKGLEIVDRYKIIKTKLLHDTNDFRGTVILSEQNVISVVGGKLSGAYLAADEIVQKLR